MTLLEADCPLISRTWNRHASDLIVEECINRWKCVISSRMAFNADFRLELNSDSIQFGFRFSSVRVQNGFGSDFGMD